MDTLTVYILWISVYLIAIAFIQRMLVRGTATATQNRWFITGGAIFSVLIGVLGAFPVVGYSGNDQNAILLLPEVVVGAYSGIETPRQDIVSTLSTQRVLLYLSLGVSAALFLRMAAGVVYLLMKIRYCRRMTVGGCRVLPVKTGITPFSFFGYVFLPESLIGQKELSAVITHEKAHISAWHTADLLFFEFLTILLWFNPAVWYLRREIKMQHEFQADNYVLENKFDRLSYQNTLLDMSMAGLNIPVINPFNYSPIKRRIMMMNEKTGRGRGRAALAMFAVIPVFLFLFLLQACDLQETGEVTGQVEQEKALISDYQQDKIFTVVEEPPRFPGGETARQAFLGNNLVYPEEARLSGIQGTVFISFVVEKDGSISNVEVLRGIGGGCDEEAVRVVEMMPRWEPGKQRGEAVRVQFNMPVRFRLNDTADESRELFQKTAGTYLIIYDGQEIGAESFGELDELVPIDRIESIQVLTGEAANEFGHERVLKITSKAESDQD